MHYAHMIPFWKEFFEWLEAAVLHILKKNPTLAMRGIKVFLKRKGTKFLRAAEIFSKLPESEKWLKTTAVNEQAVKKNELPKEILEKINVVHEEKIDITDEARYQINLQC